MKYKLFILSACGTSLHEDLQATDWNEYSFVAQSEEVKEQ